MLVSREEVDCRSEPDTSIIVGGSQDRLSVPAMSSISAGSPSNVSSVPINVNANDSAVRRRRLSNLYKVRMSLLIFSAIVSIGHWFVFFFPLLFR